MEFGTTNTNMTRKHYSSFCSKFKNTTDTINWCLSCYLLLCDYVPRIQFDSFTAKSQIVETLPWLQTFESVLELMPNHLFGMDFLGPEC